MRGADQSFPASSSDMAGKPPAALGGLTLRSSLSSAGKDDLGVAVECSAIPNFKQIGRHMPRTKYQRGSVELTGTRVKKWRGQFRVYLQHPDGKPTARRRKVILGLKSEMTKGQARQKLADIIQQESGTEQPRPDSSVTFTWFWSNRFWPLHQKRWRPKTARELDYFFKGRLEPLLGATALGDITRFQLQQQLNRLADEGASSSLVHKFRTWTKAVLDEAIEQRFLERNPARKLTIPNTRPSCKRFLTVAEVCRLLGSLVHQRDRLIVRLFVLCALRGGELFALRWDDWQGDLLRVDESIVEGELGPTKTEGSTADVTVPKSLQLELECWRIACGDVAPRDFMFASSRGTPLDGHNYLRRFLQPVAEKIGIPGLTFQALRRTFATLVQGKGSVKDAQAQLRHAHAATTLGIYTQAIPDSVAAAVEALDKELAEMSKEAVQ